MPHVVFELYMFVKRNGLVVELGPVKAAYETCVSECVVFFLLFLSQIAERVDDHTKNEIQCDNDDYEEEEQIIDHSEHKQWFLYIILKNVFLFYLLKPRNKTSSKFKL